MLLENHKNFNVCNLILYNILLQNKQNIENIF